MPRFTSLALLILTLLPCLPATAEGPVGYYRQPALHGDTIVFVAEGDLWKVDVAGGAAQRLTSHPDDEDAPAIAPDGRTIAFIGRYEGPAEVYTMPIEGGRPTRRTYGAGRPRVEGWTEDGVILMSTDGYSTLPNRQLVRLDVSQDDVAGTPTLIPLAQAADGSFADDARTLFFTRLPFQGSHTKRYQGGTAQNIWRFAEGDAEATPLTADYAGTSKRPMWWNGRVYFATDRDGTMNLWSMTAQGGDVRQHTRHAGWDLKTPSLQDGRIAYQLGADIHLFDIVSGQDRTVAITLGSDLDQTREHWIDDPMSWLTAAHLSPDGDRVVLTARGQIFVAPHRQGRLVEVDHTEGVRYRRARFMPDGERLVALSDESGEIELWTLPANGVGEREQITRDGEVLRWRAVPSPDGRWVAHHDKNFRLFIHDLESNESRLIDTSQIDDFFDLRWSPDGRWLAYVAWADNMFRQIRLYSTEDGRTINATSDRFDSYSPAWAPNGEWLYLLSDRNLRSVVGSPWGNYQPEPFLDKKTLVYHLALQRGLRSPFQPLDELHAAQAEAQDKKDTGDAEHSETPEEQTEEETLVVEIDTDGLWTRLTPLPVPAGNYSALAVNDAGLFWQSRASGATKTELHGAKIANIDFEVKTIHGDISSYELSADGKKMLLRTDKALYIVDAQPTKADLTKKNVNLGGWKLAFDPREEWRQMFIESWRLERDYFYDPDMHGVDWPAMLEKYLPLVNRVTTRQELSDLMAQMVSELAALHIFVRSGNVRPGTDDVRPGALGAVTERDENAGGYRVTRIYRSDPDQPTRRSPLAAPGVEIGEGDVIEMVNGRATLSAPALGALLRNQTGRQTLLRVRSEGETEPRDVIITPMSAGAERDLRYHDWGYTRRLRVEERSNGQIGYVHLRAMGGGNFTEWAREYYPVFNRKGLIVDVRHNRGGNIDSWILGRLIRKAWFQWSQRQGHAPNWNMQQAFRGHVAVLCNERTASDGEAFAEGARRLGIGRLFGTRTWGGEIWLTSSNRLVDRGIATAAEFGVYGPEGDWLIEGWGVEPDVVIDNLPHATFLGSDAQLDAAVDHLLQRIAEEPVPDLPPPPHPDKSFDNN